jgi:hypothetical protein
VHEPVAKHNHFHHRFAKARVEVASLNEETEDIAAFFQFAKAVDGDNVRSNVDAALYSSLKGALDGQSPRKVIPQRRQCTLLMLL